MTVMRWLTDEAYEGSNAAWNAALKAYGARLDEIRDRIPAALLALGTDPRMDLKDGRFREVTVDRQARTVELLIAGGNLQVGYRRLSLRFERAAVVPDNLLLLAKAVGAEFRANEWHQARTATEIRVIEVDLVSPRRFALRLRLWPFHAFAIEFGAILIEETPLDVRGPARAGRFVVR